MAIDTYVGVPGVAINVESIEELYDALDILHTQIMDNLKSDLRLIKILDQAMNQVEALFDAPPNLPSLPTRPANAGRCITGTKNER